MPDKVHVLVVDDNEMNRDMLSRRLKRQEYEVTIAEDGERALEIVQQQSFSLVLLDIMMPNLSGYEVLERLKADPKTQHIPVIMISAVDDLDSVVRCIELGAEDYLFKPFNPVLLKARVEASLRKNSSNIHQGEVVSHIQALVEQMAQLQQMQLESNARQVTETLRVHVDALAKLIQ
jgi:DNA-binding response OmpR family regulator